MPFAPNNVTKKFVQQAKELLNTGKVKRYSDIAEAVEWDKTALSNVINGRRNIPQEIYKEFTTVYNVEEIKNPAHMEQGLVKELMDSLKKNVAALEKQVELQEREAAIQAERVKAINTAFDRIDRLQSYLNKLEKNQLMILAAQRAYQEYWAKYFPVKGVKPEDVIIEIDNRAVELVGTYLSSDNH